jgi:hypothetical protein
LGLPKDASLAFLGACSQLLVEMALSHPLGLILIRKLWLRGIASMLSADSLAWIAPTSVRCTKSTDESQVGT